MKKIVIFILFIFALSGCSFDFVSMTCKLESNPVTYEVRYKDNDIKAFDIVEEKNYSGYNEDYFNNTLIQAEKRAETLNKIDGLNETIKVDDKYITIVLEIDYEKYDLKKDKHHILTVDIEDKDMENIESIRSLFVSYDYTCDEIVKENLN